LSLNAAPALAGYGSGPRPVRKKVAKKKVARKKVARKKVAAR